MWNAGEIPKQFHLRSMLHCHFFRIIIISQSLFFIYLCQVIGLHYEPTILTNVTHAMRVANEESFGPIMPIIKFKYEVTFSPCGKLLGSSVAKLPAKSSTLPLKV